MIPSGVALKDIEFFLNEVVFGFETEGTQGLDSEFGGEFEDFGVETLVIIDGTDGMAHEDVPDGDGELACDGDNGFVAASAHGECQSPFAQRIVDLKKALGGLNEDCANGAATVRFESAAALPVSALGYTRVESEVSDEFFGVCKSADVPNGADDSVDANEVETGEASQTQKFGIGRHFESHLVAEFLTTSASANQAEVRLFQEQELDGSPILESFETIKRSRSGEAKAWSQANAVFIEHALDMLLETGGFAHDALVGAKELPAFQGLRIGLPDQGGKSAQIDACDLDGVNPVVGTVGLADFPGHVTFHDQGVSADGLESSGYGKCVAAGLHDQGVLEASVALGPGFELGQGHLTGGVCDFCCGRIFAFEDSRGKGIWMDIESNDSTLRASHG